MLPISPKHIVAYSQCPRKAFLMLTINEPYELSEYEQLLQKFQNQSFDTYCEKLPNSSIYKENSLKKGFDSIQNCKIELDGFEFESKILLKKEGKSNLGKFSYEPVIFLGTNQIAKENRLELAFLGFLLDKIQNKSPEKGIIIGKNGGKHQVELAKLKKSLKTAIAEIQDFDKNPPKLLLNRHCPQCPFENLCKNQAQKEDNLSLLDRITSKQISKLDKKGIFTIKQLSFIYKPRRRNKKVKNPPISFKPELQALAIRTQKTYIQRLPELNRKPTELFLDIEGLPDEGFFYLFGILLIDADTQNYYSFWADNQQDESVIWNQTIQLITSYPESPIYHYGSFEPTAFEKLAKKYNTNIEEIKKRFININTFIYGKIYFPAYSNGLKDLGKLLGAKWSNEKASGLQTIIWRNAWEEGQQNLKPILQTYNQEDCLALKILTDELTRIKTVATTSNDVEFVQNPKKIASEVSKGVHNHFNSVLIFAHSNANKSKISFEKHIPEYTKSKRKGITFSTPKITKKEFVNHIEFCPLHTDNKLITSKMPCKKIIVDIIFSKNGVRKSVTEYSGWKGYCELCDKYHKNNIYENHGNYGFSFKAWLIYQRVALQLPYSKINESLDAIFGKKMSCVGNYANFMKNMASFYQETECKIITQLHLSTCIHADETSINIKGNNQYIWTFTNDKYVVFKLSINRESNLAFNFLNEYKGVLITDFFSWI